MDQTNMNPSSGRDESAKEDIIRRVMEASDHKEKMALISENFEMFSAREIEDLSHRVIEDLQASLDRHERAARQGSPRTMVTEAGETDEMTVAVDGLRSALDAQMDRERSFALRADEVAGDGNSIPSGPHHEGTRFSIADEDGLETGSVVLSASGPTSTDAPAAAAAPSQDFTPFVRKVLRARAAAAHNPPEKVTGLVAVLKWSLVALVINAVAFLGVSFAVGPAAARFAPLAIWILFCLWGYRRDEMSAPLGISLLTFLILGWGAIQNVVVSLFLIPVGSPPPLDHVALIAAFLGLFVVTFFWRPMGKGQRRSA